MPQGIPKKKKKRKYTRRQKPEEALQPVTPDVGPMKDYSYDKDERLKELEAENSRLRAEIKSNRPDQYIQAATRAVMRARNKIFDRCCGKKALTRTCERYSCKHILVLLGELELLLIRDGAIKSVQYAQPREDVGRGRHRGEDPEFKWENTFANPGRPRSGFPQPREGEYYNLQLSK